MFGSPLLEWVKSAPRKDQPQQRVAPEDSGKAYGLLLEKPSYVSAVQAVGDYGIIVKNKTAGFKAQELAATHNLSPVSPGPKAATISSPPAPTKQPDFTRDGRETASSPGMKWHDHRSTATI